MYSLELPLCFEQKYEKYQEFFIRKFSVFAGDFFNIFQQFVCVEVLRPSQPSGVMLSAVSLPNHMSTGQA